MTAPELEQLIKKSGQQWLLDERADEKLPWYLGKLQQAFAVFQQRFSGDDISFDDQVLLQGAEPHELAAILQTLPWHTPDFIAAIWRIIRGDRIAAISLQYTSIASFHLKVTIVSEDHRTRREVESDQVEDAAFLRHVPIGRINDKPFFVGYFPFPSPG